MTVATDERTVLTVVPSAVFVSVNISKREKTKIHRWVNLAQIKTVTFLEEVNEIHLQPIQGLPIKVVDPESVTAIVTAIASYSVHG